MLLVVVILSSMAGGGGCGWVTMTMLMVGWQVVGFNVGGGGGHIIDDVGGGDVKTMSNSGLLSGYSGRIAAL